MSTIPDIDLKLREALRARRPFSFLTGSDIDKIDNSSNWGPERTIDADTLRTVLLAKDSDGVPSDQPLDVRGARIAGHLNVSGLTVSRALFLWQCEIVEPIDMGDASAMTVLLQGCKVHQIHADRAQINGSLLIRNCEFAGKLSIARMSIGGDLELTASRFGDKAPIEAGLIRVNGAVFLNDHFSTQAQINFAGAHVGSAFDARLATFNCSTNRAIEISGAEIGGYCDLAEISIRAKPDADGNVTAISAQRLSVKDHLTLSNAKVHGSVLLASAQIGDRLDLSGVSIENPNGTALDLQGSKIGGDVLMVSTPVRAENTMTPTSIVGGVFMSSAVLGGSLVIEDAVINTGEQRDLWLNRMTVSEVFHLRNASITTQEMSLSNTKVSWLSDDARSWPSRIGLNGFDYGAFTGNAPTGWHERVAWVRRHQQDEFNPQPFTHLAAVLRRMGHERSAKMIAIERQRDARRRLTTLSPRWLLNVLLELTCAHGYRPSLAAGWAVIFIGLGAAVFGYAYGEFVPVKDAALAHYRTHNKAPADYPPLKPLIYSADVFLPIVNLQQKEYWAPDAGKNKGYIAWAYRPLHILAGWFFTTLFVAGVTGLIRKD